MAGRLEPGLLADKSPCIFLKCRDCSHVSLLMTHMEFVVLMIYRKHNKTGSCRISAMQLTNLDKSNSMGRSQSNLNGWQI